MRQGDVVYYLSGDHLGSTSLTTDENGDIVSEVRYLPYGEERWSSGATPTDFTFTGQRNEAGFGLMDYNARYYSARLGRFVSPDTIVPEPWHSGAFNRYTYVNNNPVRFSDPTGHQCMAACPPLPPPQVNWQEIVKVSVPLAASVPEVPVAVATTVTAITFAGGAYLGSAWAMQDMGPDYQANPWTGGFSLLDGEEFINVTTPFPGTNTIGSNVETISPPDVEMPLDLPGPPLETQTPNTVLDFPANPGIELPTVSASSSEDNWRSGRRLSASEGRAMPVFDTYIRNTTYSSQG
jgi:RHS repeat-associated protein